MESMEYRNFVIAVTSSTYSFPLAGYTFVFRSLQRAKDAIDFYFATGAYPCEVYTSDGNVIDAERGGAWLG